MFVKEIEHALLTKEIDMAVHSMKDMPAVLPEGLMIGCTPKRVDLVMLFISKNGASFKELAEGAILGTSSLRRSAQLLAARPDLQVGGFAGISIHVYVNLKRRRLRCDYFSDSWITKNGLG